uniref:polynucleotide adenylyltransferase n=1 Tax=Athene cunicularia TaxID=194338 RepID=A0A663MWM8_ATHCN
IKPSGALKDGQELSHSLVVLGNLNPLVNEWISELSEKSSPSAAASVGGKIVPLGSYWLRAHTKGGGRDVVSVAPRHIERSDSFQSFFEILKHQEEIKNLRAVEDAYVPAVKFEFDGVEIDLMFARPSVQTVSDNLDLGDDWHLRSLDMRCILSLNGEVANEMLHLVLKEENFRLTLCAIKLIYSNLLGFLGGVSCTMLVARTCPLYSKALASALVNKLSFFFFKMVRAIVYFNLQKEVTLLEVVLHIRFMWATFSSTLNYMAEF